MSHVGRPAPGFANLLTTAAPSSTGEAVSLGDYAGRWLVLHFFPGEFDSICSTELLAFNRRCAELRELGAELLAVSTESIHCHRAWLRSVGQLDIRLASDTTLTVSRAYGVLLEDEAIAQRGLFIVDPEGTVRYEAVHDLDVARSADEVVRVLAALLAADRSTAERPLRLAA
jgi:peroxiredoxin (alkyl hydroperoxide reductase subunit C)